VKSFRIPKADYSKIAEHYDNVRPAPNPVLVSKIVEFAKISKRSSVLDVGCGTGRFPVIISNITGSDMCALDPSMEMLKRATSKDRSKRILWIRAEGQHLPFKDSLFDCVYMTAALHHIEDKEKAIREVYRALRRDGTCVIVTFSHYAIKKHITHDFPGVVAIDLKRIPTVPSVKGIMTKASFRAIHHHTVKIDEGYVPTDEYLERVRNKYMSTLTLLDEEAFQRGLRIFEKRVRSKYGGQIKRISRFVLVAGRK
jgi:ubiquinone/menaquinone biosynthesis C-methylase UbiE